MGKRVFVATAALLALAGWFMSQRLGRDRPAPVAAGVGVARAEAQPREDALADLPPVEERALVEAAAVVALDRDFGALSSSEEEEDAARDALPPGEIGFVVRVVGMEPPAVTVPDGDPVAIDVVIEAPQ